MIIMIIPVHHIQSFRYACPSPVALPCFAVALNSPFFFTTNLSSVHTLGDEVNA